MKNLRDCQIVVSKQFNLLENLRTGFGIEEHFDLIEEIGRNHRISING